MKKLLALILVLCPILAFGQYVNPTPDYQFKGQVSVGTDTNAYVPSLSSSWLTVGPDSTNKGLILPRVVDTSDIANPGIGTTIYQYTDSAIYVYVGKWLKVDAGGSIGLTNAYFDSIYTKIYPDSLLRYVHTMPHIDASIDSNRQEGILLKYNDTLYNIFSVFSTTSHISNTGAIFMRKKIGSGEWSSDWLVYNDTSYDDRNVCAGFINDSLFVLFRQFDSNGDTGVACKYVYSSDFGNTWSAAVTLISAPPKVNSTFFDRIIENNGVYYAPLYNEDSSSIFLWYTKDGINWQNKNVIDSLGVLNVPVEPELVNVGSGKMILFTRNLNASKLVNGEANSYLVEDQNNVSLIGQTNIASGHPYENQNPIGSYADTSKNIILVATATRGWDSTASPVSTYNDSIFVYINTIDSALSDAQSYKLLFAVRRPVPDMETTYGYCRMINNNDGGYFLQFTERWFANNQPGIRVNQDEYSEFDALYGINIYNVPDWQSYWEKKSNINDSFLYPNTARPDSQSFINSGSLLVMPKLNTDSSFGLKVVDTMYNPVLYTFRRNTYINQLSVQGLSNNTAPEAPTNTATIQGSISVGGYSPLSQGSDLASTYIPPFASFRSIQPVLSQQPMVLEGFGGAPALVIRSTPSNSFDSIAPSTPTSRIGSIDFEGNGTTVSDQFSRKAATISGYSNAIGTNYVEGQLRFYTTNNTGTYSERMRLNSNGLSIAPDGSNISPNWPLTVKGNAHIDGSLITTGDAMITGITAGRGGGNIATNTVFGSSSLTNNTTGLGNSAFGGGSLSSNSVGNYNTGLGYNAMQGMASGSDNTAIGANSLNIVGSGSNNIALGYGALSTYSGSWRLGIGVNRTVGDSSTMTILGDLQNRTLQFPGYLAASGDTSLLGVDDKGNMSKINYVKIVPGSASQNGDGTTTAFTISVSPGFIPSKILITPTSEDAAKAVFYVSAKTSTSFTVTSTGTTPPSGTNNVTFDYELIK